MLPIMPVRSRKSEVPSPGPGCRRNSCGPSAQTCGECDGANDGRSPGEWRQPQVKATARVLVGRLLDSSTKKSQTVNRFGKTAPNHNGRVWVHPNVPIQT